jgi:hypothetical protein
MGNLNPPVCRVRLVAFTCGALPKSAWFGQKHKPLKRNNFCTKKLRKIQGIWIYKGRRVNRLLCMKQTPSSKYRPFKIKFRGSALKKYMLIFRQIGKILIKGLLKPNHEFYCIDFLSHVYKHMCWLSLSLITRLVCALLVWDSPVHVFISQQIALYSKCWYTWGYLCIWNTYVCIES